MVIPAIEQPPTLKTYPTQNVNIADPLALLIVKSLWPFIVLLYSVRILNPQLIM